MGKLAHVRTRAVEVALCAHVRLAASLSIPEYIPQVRLGCSNSAREQWRAQHCRIGFKPGSGVLLGQLPRISGGQWPTGAL
jgi:hypothetical protein